MTFANAMNTLGIEKYSDSFAGAQITPAGKIILYAVPSDDASFLGAVPGVDPLSIPYTVVAVSHDYAQLNELTQQLAKDQPTLTAEGIAMSSWGPNAATGTVEVTLGTPSPADLAEVAVPAGLPRVTAGTYAATVTSILRAKYGQTYITVALGGVTNTAYNRFSDTPPYWGGDRIWNTLFSVYCTGGFNVIGNNSGHHFMLTAGHCGTSSYWARRLHRNFIGTTSTNYWYTTSGYRDFQTIGASTQGYVYYNYPSNAGYLVAGQTIPANGDEITYDGATQQQQLGIVSNNDACAPFSVNGTGYVSCGLVESYPITATTPLCAPGDSGGPVFYYTGNGEISAIGTIVGGSTSVCYAQRIDIELSVSNTHLELYYQ